jgi:hypothetical protein
MKQKFRFFAFKFSGVLLLLMLFSLGINAQEISKMLVGTNVWYNPSATVWNQTAQCGVGSIRIGGHAYDDAMPSNSQLLAWVKNIQGMGAEPIIQVSQYGTIENATAKAAALVKYFNIDSASGKPVKYWNIGNEPWLQAGKPPVSTAGALVEKYFKPISVAMKAVDSTIKVFGPDFCYYIDEGINDLYGGKNDISGKIPGKTYYYSDGISWHNYPQGTGSPAYEGVESFRSAIVKCKAKVDAVNILRKRTGDEALQWGIGEYNSKSGEVVHTWENGQMFGAILGMCMQYDATYATTWSMYEGGGSRTGSDFSFIDGNGTPRASYRHMQMIARNFSGSYVNGKSAKADIIVFGSKNADTVSVLIMNRAAGAPVSYTLNLSYENTIGEGIKLNIDAGSDISYMDIISGKATQLLVFKGGEIIKTTYTSLDFANNKAPVVTTVIKAGNAPSEPTSLVCIPLSEKAVLLNWEASATDTISGFIIERKAGGEANFSFVDIVSSDLHTYTDSNLKDTTNYIYRVNAYNTAGKSAYSFESNATTFKLYRVAFNGPHYIPGKIEIEDFDKNDEGTAYHDIDPSNQGKAYRSTEGVDIESCTDAGLGFNVGYINAGEWLIYTIDSITNGTYDISLRFASAIAGTRKVKIYMNSILLGSVSPVLTGGWQVWQTITLPRITITKGTENLLKLFFEGADFNLNWIEFTKSAPAAIKENINNSSVKIFPNPAGDLLQIELKSEAKSPEYSISDLGGKTNKSGFLKGGLNQLDISDLEQGYYHIEIKMVGHPGVFKPLIKL